MVVGHKYLSIIGLRLFCSSEEFFGIIVRKVLDVLWL